MIGGTAGLATQIIGCGMMAGMFAANTYEAVKTAVDDYLCENADLITAICNTVVIVAGVVLVGAIAYKVINKVSSKTVNIDTGTALAFVSQDSPTRHELKQYVQGKNMVMTETAFEEFNNIVKRAGGDLEQSRAERFLKRITIIPDDPSEIAMNLKITRRLGANDRIIFGTGDNLNIVTMTSDAKFVRAASAQGVDFNVYVHTPRPLQGR